MIIGALRPEEARVFDTRAGYHQFHSEETQEPFGSFEIFWHPGGAWDDEEEAALCDDWQEEKHAPGWYWRACLPDGEANGPFSTSRDALEDADEWNPEFN